MEKIKEFVIPEIVNNQDSVAIQIILPFKEETSTCLREYPAYQCIADNQNILIEALQTRMKECYDGLVNNSSRITYNDGYTITYKTEERHCHSFNIPSWNAMKDVLDALKVQNQKDWTVQMYEQLLKAICLQECKFDIKNRDKVVSYLINHIVCHN